MQADSARIAGSDITTILRWVQDLDPRNEDHEFMRRVWSRIGSDEGRRFHSGGTWAVELHVPDGHHIRQGCSGPLRYTRVRSQTRARSPLHAYGRFGRRVRRRRVP